MIHIDVTTLLALRGTPTGIPRTLAMVLQHWLADGREFRLVAFDPVWGTCAEVPRDDPRLVRSLTPTVASGVATPAGSLGLASRLLEPLKAVARAGRRVFRAATRPLLHLAGRLRGDRVSFLPGDTLFLAGLGWHEAPVSTLARLRRTHRVRVVHLLYDIIPLRCPQWSSPDLGVFASWLPAALREADGILTISDFSRRDLLDYAKERGIACPPVEVIRLGDEPGDGVSEAEPALPREAADRFALCVSTVSAHKNQRLLLDVWRRLIARHGSQLPRLVLVGGLGFQGETILGELSSDPLLSRHVTHLRHASDAELRWLYKRCLFTLFPSRYEGWGLPVAESLAHGKACIASNAASIPEVGGGLVEYHGPSDVVGCAERVEGLCFRPGRLAEAEARLKAEHRVTPWAECARGVWSALASGGQAGRIV